MEELGQAVAVLLFLLWWLAGIAVVKGFWLVVLAVAFPPFAMYALIERVASLYGLIPCP